MRTIFTRRLAGPAVIAVAVTAMALVGTAAQAVPQVPGASAARSAYTPSSGVTDPCPPAAPGDAGCAALVSTPAATSEGKAAGRSESAASTATPAGYSLPNLQRAYD